MHKIGKIVIIFIILIVIVGTLFELAWNIFKVSYKNTVTYNGELRITDASIMNQFGEKVELKGLSSNGVQWETSDCIDNKVLKYLNENWNVNVFRIAVYTEENGYISNKEKIYNKTIRMIQDCIDADIYAIVDWHINKDGNPNQYKNEAKEFFKNISEKYKNTPNIIYEICNEPNNVTWDEVKEYANEVIPVIRKNASNSIIIVGTPNYSKDIELVNERRLDYPNIMYSFHFYVSTHKEAERIKLEYAIAQKVPVIVTEWGTSEFTGDGECDFDESDKWLELLNNNKISWVNWSFSYNKESSSILKRDIRDIINQSEHKKEEIDDKLIDKYLTDSGKYIKKKLQEQKQ